jgi:CRISPR/Cas system-associated exonuclease Cas4 (RecB family)
LISPYFELAMLSNDWPSEFRVPIKEHSSHTDDWFHPSSHGLMPERLLYFQVNPATRVFRKERQQTIPDVMSPLLGTMLHHIVEEKLQASGMIAKEHIEVALVNERVHGRGQADFIFPNHPAINEDVVVDIKTSAPANFERMYYPYKNHVAQLNLYMDWYGEMVNKKITTGVIFVIEMGRPFRTKEFKIKRDEALLAGIYQRWETVRRHIAMGYPPPEKCCELNSDTMGKCPHADVCRETYR